MVDTSGRQDVGENMTVADAPNGDREIGDAVAAAWERHRTLLFESQRPVSEWLVDHVDPRPGQTILELAAGPGETGFLAAERVGPDGRLISTDVSPRMVDAARRGAEARGLGNVEFRVMDAQQLDLPDSRVDGVLSRFGVMLIPEPERALHEARRVLRDGGCLAYAVWGQPDRNPWLTTFVGAIARSGHAPPGDPFGPSGPFSLAAEEVNRELLAAAGFSDVHVEEIESAFRFDDFDGYWNLQSEVAGPVAVLLASLASDEVDDIRTALKPAVEPFQSNGGLAMPSLAVVVSAR
jgi:ubiquinone/menaquinone biosynthesis C-methylase UbiE